MCKNHLIINTSKSTVLNQLNVLCRIISTNPPKTLIKVENDHTKKMHSYKRRYISKMFQNFCQSQADDLGKDKSCKLMMYNEVIAPCTFGAFHLLPFGHRAVEKLVRIIDEEMEYIGGQKMSMPSLAPDSMWNVSGRWDSTGEELFKLTDRHGDKYCLGPTHEEVVTSMMATWSPFPTAALPVLLYQITRKFRDEISPKRGLLRSREFEMKDMYSFDTDEKSALQTYQSVCSAYCKVFDRLCIPFKKVQGCSGNIGGRLSHEYHFLAETGKDKVLFCLRCGLSQSKEYTLKNGSGVFDSCQGSDEHCELLEKNGIEVGHCFYLGTKYSSVFKATFQDEDGCVWPMHMGCYGLGVTRILHASLEVLSQDRRLRWPGVIAPYQVCIIPQKKGYKSDETFRLAEEISDALNSLPNLLGEVVIDDRLKYSIGRRLYEAKRHGFPFVVILGRQALAGTRQLEVIDTTREEPVFFTLDQLLDMLSTVHTV